MTTRHTKYVVFLVMICCLCSFAILSLAQDLQTAEESSSITIENTMENIVETTEEPIQEVFSEIESENPPQEQELTATGTVSPDLETVKPDGGVTETIPSPSVDAPSVDVSVAEDPTDDIVSQEPQTKLPIYLWFVIGAIVVLSIIAIRLFMFPEKNSAPIEPDQDKVNTVRMDKSISYPITIGNECGIGSRKDQQDSFGLSDVYNLQQVHQKGVFAVVADGMGGLKNGSLVSTTVKNTMLKLFDAQTTIDDASTLLLTMVEKANRAVLQVINHTQSSGSTVIATHIMGTQLHFISVGDSRIYLIRQGRVLQINREHTYGIDLDEQAAKGIISRDEAKQNKKRHALTSYVGMTSIPKIDRNIHPIQLQNNDKVLLMSDGVFGTISDEEILQCCAYDETETVRRIKEAVQAKAKRHQDNFTIVALQYHE